MTHWWENYPWRMIQTNLREPDMENICASQFAQEAKAFGATVVMVNAAGIVASYDTDIQDQPRSEYLKADTLAQIIDECHKAGLRVIARTDFSKVRRSVFERHPEWAYRDAKGDLFDCNGDIQVCPNSGYHRQVVYDILKELLTRLPFDGIFFNMSGAFVTGYDGALHGPCMCDTCRTLYKEKTGMEAPAGGMRDPGFMRYIGFQSKLIAQNKARQYRFIKEINTELAVNGYDYMRTECNTDIGHGAWIYGSSTNARKGNRMRIVDNACVDFISFRYRDSSVSPALIETRLWQSLANGGGLSFYIMGRLDNHRDTSGFAAVRKVFDFHKQHEDLFTGLRSGAEVLVVQKGSMGRNDPEVYGWIHALTQSHIPFDAVRLPELTKDMLQGKRAVILGDLSLNAEQATMLDTFAFDGGTVLATGGSGVDAKSQTALLKCLGIAALGERNKGLMSTVLEVTDTDKTAFSRCADAPYIAVGGEYRNADFTPDTQKWLHLVPEHPYGPPERCYPVPAGSQPGVTVHPYGSGRGIWMPWLAGSMYFNEGWQNTLNVMQDVLFGLCGLSDLAPDLTPMVELTLSRKEETLVVQLVNETGCFANHYFPPVPVHDIQIKLPNGYRAAQTLNGGKVTICQTAAAPMLTLDTLREYEAIVITKAEI